jgi:hypothetical protein
MIFRDREDTLGAQTLNRTPSLKSVAPRSNVHDFFFCPLFIIRLSLSSPSVLGSGVKAVFFHSTTTTQLSVPKGFSVRQAHVGSFYHTPSTKNLY